MPAGEGTPYRRIIDTLNRDVRDCTPLERLALSVSLQPGEVALLVMLSLLIFGLLGLYTHYTVTLLASIYPGYMSLKVLLPIAQSLYLNSQENHQRWLTFWIIFGLFTGFDRPLSQLLFFLPQYYPLKMVLFLLLSLPRFDLAYKLHRRFFDDSVRRFKSFSGMY